MQECYLDADSKGIIPEDLEDRAEYLMRATKLQEVCQDAILKGKIAEWLKETHLYEGYLAEQRFPPSKAISVMDKKFVCDMSWVPYFGAFPIKGKGSILNQGAGFYCNYPIYAKDIDIPVVVHYHFKKDAWQTGVHELIHAVRNSVDIYRGTGKIVSELLANNVDWFKLDDGFLGHPLKTAKWYWNIQKISRRLNRCFGDMSDYALIRLSKDEIKSLSDKNTNESVIAYFRDKACIGKGLHDRAESELRFSIMCARLGL